MQSPSVPRIGSNNPLHFVREVISELKKVTWPTRQETVKLTVLVIVLSAVVGVFVGGIDALLVSLSTVVFGGK